jgi:hypothetical protein
MTSKTLHDIK